MNALTGGPENYIFYLQLGNELQDEFFQLSHFFNQWRITLIPVLPKQLPEMVEKGRNHILAHVPDHLSYERYTYSFKRYLKMGLLSKKYCLHELSSFSKVPSAHQFERTKSYFQYRLPVDVDLFVKSVVKNYYLEKRVNKKWPGTRRGRLPSLVSGV